MSYSMDDFVRKVFMDSLTRSQRLLYHTSARPNFFPSPRDPRLTWSGAIFGILWTTYFERNLRKLSMHPVANFVVAQALERAESKQLSYALSELRDSLAAMTVFEAEVREVCRHYLLHDTCVGNMSCIRGQHRKIEKLCSLALSLRSNRYASDMDMYAAARYRFHNVSSIRMPLLSRRRSWRHESRVTRRS
ncbi:hypothetical protein BJY52DRAFT_359760, partial [Lactarius psammicola]